MNALTATQKLYTPQVTTNYDFPITEVPLVARMAEDENAQLSRVIDLPTQMKGIIRTDTNKVIASVSDKYTLVPHKKVIDAGEMALAKHGTFSKKVYTTHDGARLYGEYLLDSMDGSIAGDDMKAMIIVRNSYDASSSVSIAVQGLRLVCLNGMMGMGTLFSFGKRHVGQIDFGDSVQQNIDTSINRYNDNLIPFWKNLSEKKLSLDYGIDIIKQSSDEAIMPKKYEEEVINKWETEASIKNAWILLNCFTFVFTHVIKRKSYENYLNLNKKISQFIGGKFIS